MSADTEQLPIYIVTATNWTIEVPMDEYNVQFDKEAQVLEAATRAVEAWKSMRDDVVIVMNADSKDEKAQMGTTLLVHTKGEDQSKHAIIFTYICMGNTGLYKEAGEMKVKLDEQVAALRRRQLERERVQKEVRDFEEMARALHPKNQAKPKRIRKPKSPGN